MITHSGGDRADIIEAARAKESVLAEVVELVTNDRLFFSTILTQTPETDPVESAADPLLAGAYVLAHLVRGQEKDELNLSRLKLRVTNHPTFAAFADRSLEVATAAALVAPVGGVVPERVATQAIIGMMIEDKMRRPALLAGVEVRTTGVRDDTLEWYTVLSSARTLRRTPRTLSERVLHLRRTGQADQVPAGYEPFATYQGGLMPDVAAHRMSFSLLHHFIHREADATIDTEPRDTH